MQDLAIRRPGNCQTPHALWSACEQAEHGQRARIIGCLTEGNSILTTVRILLLIIGGLAFLFGGFFERDPGKSGDGG
jgi:hypothetical protein